MENSIPNRGLPPSALEGSEEELRYYLPTYIRHRLSTLTLSKIYCKVHCAISHKIPFFVIFHIISIFKKTNLLLDSFSFKEKSIAAQKFSEFSFTLFSFARNFLKIPQAVNRRNTLVGLSKFAQLLSAENYPRNILSLIKAELLQLKPHPFICTRSFINKKVGNRKN